MGQVFFDDAFDLDQTNVLNEALVRAVAMVADEYEAGFDVEAKLAKIILAISRKRLAAGGELSSADDAEDLAFTASERLLSLRADQTCGVYSCHPAVL